MYRLILLAIAIGASGSAMAQEWQLVWSDEFESPGLPDPAKWDYDLGGGGSGNQELQHYTNRPENARVEDGVLIIEAHKEDYQGSEYTSGRLVTRGRAAWLYGRIEARMKLPYGQGFWPAFWMLPTDSPYGGWPSGGEIDIMEYLGHDTTRVYGTLNYGGGDLGLRSTGTEYRLESGSFADEFHTFALEWEPREMRWYVDGEHYQTQISWISARGPFPAPYDSPFHILLNLAVGGLWPGYPDETTPFPARVEVDYVRVYQDPHAYPTVTLDAPESGSNVEAGDGLSMAASASDSGTVAKVEFLQDGGLLGSDSEPPYTLDLSGLQSGCYSLSARATDDDGFISQSEPASLVVGSGCPPGSTAPYLMAPAPVPGAIEAEYYDLGGPGVAYSDLSPENDDNGIRQTEGVDVRLSRDNGGGNEITDPVAREWVSYTIKVEQAGSYRVVARAASRSGGTFRVAVDGNDLFGDVAIPPTGGGRVHANHTLGETELTSGRHVLRLDMRSSGFSLNRLTFFLRAATSVEPDQVTGPTMRLAPNPARDRIILTYGLSAATPVEIALFDIFGRKVNRLSRDMSMPGQHRVEFDVASLASGLYLCVLRTTAGASSKRVIIVH